MAIEAKIIEDSISPTRARLVTYQLRYPHFIHAEFMANKLLSTHAAPARRILNDIENDPAMPTNWSAKNDREMDAFQISACQQLWLEARDNAISYARALDGMQLHKQIISRIVAPWQHISAVSTATEWGNFFAVADHHKASPEMQELARHMHDLYDKATPHALDPGQWHLPYIQDQERFAPGNYNKRGKLKNIGSLIQASVARCARAFHLAPDQKVLDIDLDIALYDRLVNDGDAHLLEHVATPNADPTLWSGNLRGWIQYRKILNDE